MSTDFVSKIPNKPVEEYIEDEIKEMFVEMFFWIADNRPIWLLECVNRRKAELRGRKWRGRANGQKHENSNNNISTQ